MSMPVVMSNLAGPIAITALLLLITISVSNGESLTCFNCIGGLTTPCSIVVPAGTTADCEGPNAQCVLSVESYQNDAVTYVSRKCWTPPENSTATDYCKWFHNPNGQLKSCETCKDDKCNGKIMPHKQKSC